MKQIANLLAVLLAVAATIAEADATAEYSDYYAAVEAAERNDCKAFIIHLDAYLRRHPYVREKFPDFYFELRYARQLCSDRITVRGIGGEAEGIDPLPEDPPTIK